MKRAQACAFACTLHHPDHQHYQPIPYFLRPGQEASESYWLRGAEKWPFYEGPPQKIVHFRPDAWAAELRARTAFYSLDSMLAPYRLTLCRIDSRRPGRFRSSQDGSADRLTYTPRLRSRCWPSFTPCPCSCPRGCSYRNSCSCSCCFC